VKTALFSRAEFTGLPNAPGMNYPAAEQQGINSLAKTCLLNRKIVTIQPVERGAGLVPQVRRTPSAWHLSASDKLNSREKFLYWEFAIPLSSTSEKPSAR
jgi:hypothetical protein